jgi:hypothetical protein
MTIFEKIAADIRAELVKLEATPQGLAAIEAWDTSLVQAEGQVGIMAEAAIAPALRIAQSFTGLNFTSMGDAFLLAAINALGSKLSVPLPPVTVPTPPAT